MNRVSANGPGEQGTIPGRVIPKTQKNGTWCRLAHHSALYGKDQGQSGAIKEME